MDCRWTTRVSGYLDRELGAEERREFEDHLRSCPVCRTELESLRSVQEVTDTMKLHEFPDHVWDRYWEQTYQRLERKIGWIVLSIGGIILASAATYAFLRFLLADGETSWWIRLAAGLLSLGLGILLVSVIRERLFVRRTDPYRKVKR